jgi:hypothetical protein
MMDENNDVETVSENYDEIEMNHTERKPRRRERGPDKRPRTYRANSMNNFVQFKDRPEEFSKYPKEVKGVNIDGNSNLIKVLLILGGIGLAGLGG